MATMTTAQRKAGFAALMREWSADGEPTGAITKTVGQQAYDAIDQWVHDNRVSFNKALPALVRSELTALQKARALRDVMVYRLLGGVS